MNKLLIISFVLFLCENAFSQTIKVQPYLQDAEPHSIYILWETDSGSESVVEWGLTDTLGNETIGIAFNSEGDAMIHEVKLESLERFTKYYYRVRTVNAVSEIYNFKTPPFASDQEDFRIVAVSDMQRDGSFPNKFNELVHDGVIQYLSDEYGGDLIDNLALVMIPGDLVVTGSNYAQWENHFFDPSHGLFNNVPVYPVPGNHEQNSSYYFQYFKLPDNGTAGFEEHWWYKDYGNLRILGLDSNSGYRNQEQLDWLRMVLDMTCEADSIDFVFAQLHHPFKSELWTPGELDYTGEIIAAMEEFTTDCNKPSIHFFGHTHGYSRGNSRDHKHLWINVATAGGAIDNWGEFPNFDYDEFSVSQDEYGFVAVDIIDSNDPKITIRRISRGDQDGALNNILTDSLTLRRRSFEVETPIAVSPVNEEIAPECVELVASVFNSSNTQSLHGQSHWQIAETPDGFDAPVAESWKNYQNWYFDTDTQAGDVLSDEKIIGLSENMSYWWRVRYRDRELNWSDFSTAVSFQTGASIASENLLQNPGSEDSLANWTIVEGVVESLKAFECNGISPNSGDRYFAVGGLCTESDKAVCVQAVDVSMYSDSIDGGEFSVNFGGFMSNFSGSDRPEMRLIFLDQNSVVLASGQSVSNLSSNWTMFSVWENIPALTRTIQMELTGTRNAGTDNDSYFDDLFLRLGSNEKDCDKMVSVHNPSFKFPELKVSPNPLYQEAVIELGDRQYVDINLFVVDMSGVKVNCAYHVNGNKIFINDALLSQGSYVFWVRDGKEVVGNGRFIKI